MSLTREQMEAFIAKHIHINEEIDVLETGCTLIAYLLDNCQITVPEENRFFVSVNCAGVLGGLWWGRSSLVRDAFATEEHKRGDETLAYTGCLDISHTTPKWENVFSLGFCGLKQRVAAYALKADNTPKQQRFYTQVLKVYDAIDRFLLRAAQAAREQGKEEMAEGILHMTKRAPVTLFEVMQTSIAYYVFQHMFEVTYLRTMGRIDALWYDFRKKESKDNAMQLMADYFAEADRLEAPANMPFTLSCYDVNRNVSVADLTSEILDVYSTSNLTNTKFHLLCGVNTPESIVSKAFSCVQKGKNSIVFMGNETVIKSLEKMGAAPADAANYHVEGCYEAASDGEIPCTTGGRVSIPKALEFALNGGRDMLTGDPVGLATDSQFDSFDALYAEFSRQLSHLCKKSMEVTDLFESRYKQLHCAPILSSTYDYNIENGTDLYCDYGAKYNNSSINALGLATATDSLIAIKKLVFEEKRMTLDQLVEILKSDWKDQEALRIYAKNKLPKYGIGDREADLLAKAITEDLTAFIAGKPNVKGGQWRLGLASIDWRWSFGEKCAASADGRHLGETLSQNASATFGADREGATAHLTSVCAIDATNTPDGTTADIDLHSSAVRGNAGNRVLCAMLKTYFDLGGFSVHFNVLDTDILKRAKEKPQDYPTLQVRLCGWNVLFSSLSDKEKDEFIARSVK